MSFSGVKTSQVYPSNTHRVMHGIPFPLSLGAQRYALFRRRRHQNGTRVPHEVFARGKAKHYLDAIAITRSRVRADESKVMDTNFQRLIKVLLSYAFRPFSFSRSQKLIAILPRDIAPVFLYWRFLEGNFHQIRGVEPRGET